MKKSTEYFMAFAIEQAKLSLKDGNSGFGAVIIKNDEIVTAAHDTDTTEQDPTAHAETNAIRIAAKKLDNNFKGCTLVSTHEPCPMCSTAIVWSGIKNVAFGYSIQEALAQGRRRINLTCTELFKRAKADINVQPGVERQQCSLLYNKDVRESINQLRNADLAKLELLAHELKTKRIKWFHQHYKPKESNDLLEKAYQLFIQKLGITPSEAPVVESQQHKIVIHSKNFCPTLEACKILDLDTRLICKHLNEEPTQALLQQLNPNLRFSRNYDNLRPHGTCCEEMITIASCD